MSICRVLEGHGPLAAILSDGPSHGVRLSLGVAKQDLKCEPDSGPNPGETPCA